MKVGFIGLGNMGFHMVNNLLKHGVELVIYDIREEALEPFQSMTQVGDSPADVASKAEIVAVSLPTPDVVEKVAIGENGLIHGTKIKTYIDFSTTGRTLSKNIAKTLLSCDIETLDSPVSGGVPGAKDATLTLMVSGKRDVFEISKNLLKKIGKNVIYVGEEVGLAQTIKVINNLLSATNMAITSEAVVLGVKAGLNPEVMLDIINSSTGRNSASLDKFPKSVLNRHFDYGFKTNLMYKDLKLCLDMAEDLSMPMWIGSSVRQFWNYIISQGGGDEDMTKVVTYIEQWAKIEI